MIKIRKLKLTDVLNSNNLISIAVIILLAYANYNTLIDKIIGTGFLRILLIAGALFIGIVPYFFRNIRKNDFPVMVTCLYALFISLIFLDNNHDVKDGTLFFTIRVIVALMIVLFVNIGNQWMIKLPKYIAGVGFLNVIATLFFFVFRGSYRIMYRIYGFYPTGTDRGLSGYRAGIANHYSQNGTYVTAVFIALAVMMFFEKNKKKRKQLFVLTLASFVALLLTGKRGHFLFSIMALFGMYFITSKGKIIPKVFKTGFIAVFALTVFYLLGQFVPVIGNLLERFSTAGSDPESMTRFAMWNLCFEKFKEHPIFGIGWAQFPQQYYKYLYLPWYDEKYKFLNAHNVYLQILCETGIVGLLLFVMIVSFNLFTVIKTYRISQSFDAFLPDGYKQTLAVSMTLQMFFLAYCLTGNGLYDYSFYFYMFAVSSGLAVCKRIYSMCPAKKHRKLKFSIS